jgi:hypothetical protein
MFLLLTLLLAGCAQGGDADLPYVSQARSLTAEWAMINQLAADGKLTDSYVTAMRAQIREQLQAIPASLTEQDGPYAKAIGAVLLQPDDAAPQQLRGYADALKRQEDALESA